MIYMKIRLATGTGKRLLVKALDSNMSEKDIEVKAEDMALSKQRLQFLQPATMEEVVELMKRYLRRDIPVMLIGSSGFGKSELIRQAATNIPGFPVPAGNILDIRAGMLNVEDLRGLPMLVKSDDFEKSFTQSTVPTWLKKVILHPNENFVLFFDELNHASAAVLNSVYGIILERTLEDFKFAERTRIVAAGNKTDQNEDLTELSDPLLRRLEVIDIDKAIDIDTNFYERYLIDKYKDAIPEEILKLVFDPETTTADARSVERVLKAWKEDIRDGEAVLTKSGAIPMDLFARIQKIYSQKYYKPTGSQRHKFLIDQITEYIKNLKTEHPEFYIKPVTSAYRVKDLIEGKIEPTAYEDSEMTISAEGIQHIKDHFSNEPEEFVVAALSKINK